MLMLLMSLNVEIFSIISRNQHIAYQPIKHFLEPYQAGKAMTSKMESYQTESELLEETAPVNLFNLSGKTTELSDSTISNKRRTDRSRILMANLT